MINPEYKPETDEDYLKQKCDSVYAFITKAVEEPYLSAATLFLDECFRLAEKGLICKDYQKAAAKKTVVGDDKTQT